MHCNQCPFLHQVSRARRSFTLFKELGQKQTQQQSRGRKINAMDAYFYQMVERVLREELAVAFGESQQEAGRRLLRVLN